MKKLLHAKFAKVFWWYFVTYLIVLIIPMSAVLYMYKASDAKLKDDMESTIAQLLRQSRDVIDNNIKTINQIAQQISLDETLSPILADDNHSLYDCWNAQKKLRFYKSSNDVIYKINIITNNGILISDDIVTDRLEFYYNNNTRMANLSYEEWYKRLFETYYYDKYFPSCNIYSGDKNEKLLVFLKTIPIEEINKPSNVLMLLLSESRLMESLDAFKTEGGWAYILDNNNNIVSSVGETLTFSQEFSIPIRANSTLYKKDSVNVSLISEYNNWFYLASYPSGNMANNGSYALVTLIYLVVLTSVSGIIVSATFAGKETTRLTRLASVAAHGVSANNHRNVFIFLNDSITQLVQNKNKLQQRLEAELPYIKAAYFEKLFKGEFASNEELTASFAGIQLNINFNYYLVVLIQINEFYGSYNHDEIARLNLRKDYITNLAIKITDSAYEVHNMYGNRIALLFLLDDCNNMKKNVEQIACKLSEYAVQQDINLNFSAGNVCNSAKDIFLSYHEAMEALDYKPHDNRQLVVWYNEMPKQSNLYFYPMEFEARLINLVKTGNAEEAESTLDKLFEENFKNRTLSKVQCKYLFDEINGTLHKIIALGKEDKDDLITYISERLELLGNQRTIGDMCLEIKQLFRMVCKQQKNRKYQRTETLYKRVEEIIALEYNNPQLSLQSVSSLMNMNDNYFSRLFKEMFGMNFSDYVQNMRLSIAQSLLNETDMTINEIASVVGYTSAYVFRRAFKRVYGILPRQSRE